MLATRGLPNQLDHIIHKNKYVFNQEFGYIPPKKSKLPLTQKKSHFMHFGGAGAGAGAGSGLGVWDSWGSNMVLTAGSGVLTPVIQTPDTLANKIESYFLFSRNMQDGLLIKFNTDTQK